ncbi:MAG: hypothetical protein ACOC56_05115 [Atribacterota bacterium]
MNQNKNEETEDIKTIYHKDVEQFFKDMGKYEALINEEISCDICGRTITLENFRAVKKESGELLFCCQDEECMDKFGAQFGV